MAPALPLLLAIALGVDARVEASIRGEARGRHVTPAATPREADAIDLSAAPRLLLRLQEGRATAEATYAPRFTAHDLGPDHRFEQMHEGELRLRVERPRRFRLEAFAGGAAGRTDLIAYGRASDAAGGGGVITTTSTVELQRLRAGITGSAQLERRSEILASAAATVEGGTNAASRATLPVSRAVDLSAEYRWSATRIDRVGLRLGGVATRIASRNADSAIGEAMVTWRHQADRQLELRAGLGAVHLRSRIPDADTPGQRRSLVETHPAAELGFTRSGAASPAPEPGDGTAADPADAGAPRRADGASSDGLVRLSADVDRLTGIATPQLAGTAGLRWPVTPDLALLLRASASLVWPSSGRTRRGQIDLGATRALSDRISLDAGFYGARQVSTDPGLPDFSEVGAFVGVSLTARALTY